MRKHQKKGGAGVKNSITTLDTAKVNMFIKLITTKRHYWMH